MWEGVLRFKLNEAILQLSILITGSSGFIGSGLVKQLTKLDLQMTAVVRQAWQPNSVSVGEIDASTDWSEVIQGHSCVIHTAARVHVMQDSSDDPLAAFRAVNVDGTLNLARQAAAAGVKRFIFISSIKVNGEFTAAGKPFTAEDEPSPQDPYGQSKFEAEQGLIKLAKETGLEVVIIRPPLVYGPGVKGNFANMMRWIEKGVPLPLGCIQNQRSLIALDNLIDLIITCIDHPAAANQVFLASDGQDLSTTALLHEVAHVMNKPCRLLLIPPALLNFAAKITGKQAVAQRLLASLQVDISKNEALLGWKPPISVTEGLRRCVAKD